MPHKTFVTHLECSYSGETYEADCLALKWNNYLLILFFATVLFNFPLFVISSLRKFSVLRKNSRFAAELDEKGKLC